MDAVTDNNLCVCGSPGTEPHPCPYLEELYGDVETLCNCCEWCEAWCFHQV